MLASLMRRAGAAAGAHTALAHMPMRRAAAAVSPSVALLAMGGPRVCCCGRWLHGSRALEAGSDNEPKSQAPVLQMSRGVRSLWLTPLLWGGPSVALVQFGLPWLSAEGILPLFYESTVTWTMTASCALVLLPLGVVRGVANGAEEVLVPALGHIIAVKTAGNKMVAASQDMTDKANENLERFIKGDMMSGIGGSGIKGILMRAALGIFMPTTERLIENIAEARDAQQERGSDSPFAVVIESGVNGVLQENIATVRDTSTLVGLLLFIVVGAAVYMADRAARAAAEAKAEAEAKSQARMDQVHAVKDSVVDKLAEIKDKIFN